MHIREISGQYIIINLINIQHRIANINYILRYAGIIDQLIKRSQDCIRGSRSHIRGVARITPNVAFSLGQICVHIKSKTNTLVICFNEYLLTSLISVCFSSNCTIKIGEDGIPCCCFIRCSGKGKDGFCEHCFNYSFIIIFRCIIDIVFRSNYFIAIKSSITIFIGCLRIPVPYHPSRKYTPGFAEGLICRKVCQHFCFSRFSRIK